jgi:8-oxo-dGTP pyrophosphatase MutT (NUDIX family)
MSLNFKKISTADQIERPAAKTTKPADAKKVFSGVLFNLYQWPQEMFDGSIATFENLDRCDTVTLIPITEDKKIILTRQEQPRTGVFWSLPGGIMDPGETPFKTAKRELMEETGSVSEDWYHFFSSQPSGKIDWASYFFIAKNCKIKTDPNPDPGEKIEVELVDFDRFFEIMKHPSFRHHDLIIRYFRMSAAEKEEFKQFLLL